MDKKPLRSLILEDAEDDALLIVRELGQQGFDVQWERVWTASAMTSCLQDKTWDVVLSDYYMPSFDAPTALRLLQETGQDIPFIVISGTIGEDAAVAAMKDGAHDYLMKGNLARLGQAIEREQRDAGVRRDNQLAIDKIQHLNRVLRAIRKIHVLIVSEKNRKPLLKQASELLVGARGYTSALCAHLDDNQRPDIVAFSVTTQESTLARENTILDTGLSQCMRDALRSPGPVLVNSDQPVCANCTLYGAHRNTQRLATAIRHGDSVLGVLNISQPLGVSADADEIELLTETAADLGLALYAMDQAEKLATTQRESELKFRSLFEASRDALMTLSPPTWKFTSGNAATVALFGARDEADFIGRSPWEYSPERQPDGRPSGETALEMIHRAMNEGSHLFDWTHRRLSGEEFPATVLLTRIDVAGQSLVQATVRDETEKRDLHATIAQSDRLASMGMLAAGVAHEINNPLTFVLYNLESLTDDLPAVSTALRRCLGGAAELLGPEAWTALLGPDQELLNPALLDDMGERFGEALQGTRRIKEISRGLGTFSRVEQDRQVPVNLMHVIEVASSMASNEIKYRARLVKQYGKIDTILANDGRLSQVFLNLLINAAHAIEEGDVEGNEIRVRTWQEGDEVFAEVRDTGKGIPAEQLPRLFEPFFTTKTLGVGTGLGLPISKTIVQEHGGRIEVESEVGQGTRFVVRLPLRQSGGARDIQRPPTRDHTVPVRGRILVIDDEAAIRSVLGRMLGREHEVITASSGSDAQRILETDTAFDLVMCDMMMPEMSGPDLHEWLVANHPTLARNLVFVTGGAFTPRSREYLQQIENLTVEKPFDAANLIKMVRELVQASKSRG